MVVRDHKKDYSFVPLYAIADYHEYIRRGKNQSLMHVVRINEMNDYNTILGALSSIAEKCECPV